VSRASLFLFLSLCAGCFGSIRATTTARTAQEQLVCTTAAYRAVGALDSSVFAGKRVWIDVDRIQTQVDRGYVLAALEEHLIAANAKLAKTAADADLAIEMRAAALGTYDGKWNIYIPVPMLPQQFELPPDAPQLIEIGYALQEGWCRLDGYCYEPATGKYVTGWRASWGMAYVGFFDDIYPAYTIGQAVTARVQ
jgi:hypothetical protein